MATTLPDYIHVGAIVKVAEWCGVITDVATSSDHVLVLVESPKMIYRNQQDEWLDYTLNPGAWQAATLDDLRREIAEYRRRTEQRLVALDALGSRLNVGEH